MIKSKLLLNYLLKEIIAIIFYIPGLIFLKLKFINSNSLFILNYHNFSKYNNYKAKRGSILELKSAKNFEMQMEFLNKHFNFSYPETFFEGKTKHGLNILITFDDGYRDNYDLAARILKKLNVPVIFFVTTKYIDSKDYLMHDKIKYLVEKSIISTEFIKLLNDLNNGINYKKKDVKLICEVFSKYYPQERLMLNHSEIKKLFEDGFEIGNHTFDHVGLTFLTKKEQYQSINIANNDLHSIIGVRSNHIAYPNGFYDENTLGVLNQLKIKYGYTINGGYNQKGDLTSTLKRIGMNVSDSKYLLVLKLFKNSFVKFG